MPFTDAVLQDATDAITAGYPWLQLHSAAPDATGATNVTSAARVQGAWNPATGSGDADLTAPVDFTGGAASGPCTYVSLWSASAGGTYGGAFALAGDLAFNAAGEYTINTLTVNATAT